MENKFKQIASLIGDPTRASILWTLLDGKAFTATELAIAADTTPQNISMHLAKLVHADLLSVEIQGRHRYYTYSRQDVAYAVEAMASLVPDRTHTKTGDASNHTAIQYCRTCYDHLAGKVGVMITDSMIRQKIIRADTNSFVITAKGEKWFPLLDISLASLKAQRRSFIRPCLDWSERRHHIGGSVGASLLDSMLASGWLRKVKNSRAVIVTGKGQKNLYDHFGIS